MLIYKCTLYQERRRCPTSKGLQPDACPNPKKLPFAWSRLLEFHRTYSLLKLQSCAVLCYYLHGGYLLLEYFLAYLLSNWPQDTTCTLIVYNHLLASVCLP